MKRAIAMAMGSPPLVQVIETGMTHVIYVDTLTGVQYLRVYSGGVCVMVDADGKPLT